MGRGVTGIREVCWLIAGLFMLCSLPAVAQTTPPAGSSTGAATASAATVGDLVSGLPQLAQATAPTAAPSAPPAAPSPENSTSSMTLPTVEVVGVTPLPGSGVDIDKVPANVQILNSEQLYPAGQNDLLPTAADRQLSAVNLNNEQGSQFQPDFVYRGFEASPIEGVPQGIAVYQNGVRINEAFGDTVNWDLIPQFAVNRMTIQSNNPVFGLNALGGAVAIEMKNGFNFHGTEVQLAGGSYGNINGYAEQGVQFGNFAFYGAIGGTHDDGFRDQSSTGLKQGYWDLGWAKDEWTAHLSVAVADNYIGAVGPTPIQLLQENIQNVFTYPQYMQNHAELVQLTTTYQPSDFVLLSSDFYYRHFVQHLVDGNTTDVATCVNNADFFCLEGNYRFPRDALYDSLGNLVPTSVLPPGATPGEIDFSNTNTNTVGSGLQAKFTNPVLSRPNNLVVGTTVDHSFTNYTAYGELGTLEGTLNVVGSGTIIDAGLSPTPAPPIEQPVDVDGTNNYFGLFATDTLDITPRLSATASGRLNLAWIGLQDLTGIAPQLTNSYFYSHFNPGVGLTYRLGGGVTAYGGWSESNRAPTPGELSCSNPRTPCILDAFLVADPPLKQVVSQTFEAGLRGRTTLAALPGEFHWNLGAYRTNAYNDILLLATQVNGYGYYSNVGETRRQGIEAGLSYNWQKWTVNLNYSYLDAIFLDNLTLSSNSPAVNAQGNIFVHPGDNIPLMPRNRVVFNVDYQATPQWSIGFDAKFVGSQYLIGDESNQESPLPAYGVVDLHSELKVNKRMTVFVNVYNLFNRLYYTYGTYTQLDGLPPNLNLTNPETLSPSPGRVAYAGVRIDY
jgi:iron complex outermembrane recepter protein